MGFGNIFQTKGSNIRSPQSGKLGFSEEYEESAPGELLERSSPEVSLRFGHTAALPATGGHSLPPCRYATPQELLKVVWKNNIVKYKLFKVFESPENFFQKVLWWGAGASPCAVVLPDKSKFTNSLFRVLWRRGTFLERKVPHRTSVFPHNFSFSAMASIRALSTLHTRRS